jgi:NitT/TauT family transport system ATP-binding protein
MKNVAVATEPFIHLANVTKSYGKGATTHLAISNATFDVMPGELVSLVGPSGCGKSTLLKILAGLHPHDGGTVTMGSAEVPFDPARDIGMVFQQPLLLKWRTIIDNVLLPAEILGLPEKASRDARATCSRWSASPAPRTSAPTSSRAACSSGRRSPAR